MGNVRNEALVSRIVEKTELSISGWKLEFDGFIFAGGRQGQGQSCVLVVKGGVDRLKTKCENERGRLRSRVNA